MPWCKRIVPQTIPKLKFYKHSQKSKCVNSMVDLNPQVSYIPPQVFLKRIAQKNLLECCHKFIQMYENMTVSK